MEGKCQSYEDQISWPGKQEHSTAQVLWDDPDGKQSMVEQ